MVCCAPSAFNSLIELLTTNVSNPEKVWKLNPESANTIRSAKDRNSAVDPDPSLQQLASGWKQDHNAAARPQQCRAPCLPHYMPADKNKVFTTLHDIV